MSAFENLKGKLREIFQLDRNDLDFGLYRIMNLKSEEVTKFIEEDLLPQVKEGLASYASGDSANLNEELEKTVAQLRSVGLTDEMINSAPKVVELREKLKDVYSPEKIENEIYSDLYNFFKRYYSEGDFMSLRRYKEGVYALPYEGEEVKLHWANADQYYIKSSETLSNYTFKVRDRKIRFEVVDATTEQNNNKDDKNRRFRLFTGNNEDGIVNPVTITAEEIVVRFTYLANDDKTSQKDINAEICEQLLANPLLMEFVEELSRKVGSLTFLQKHINNFTAKNTFDYFIHKDLRGFLNRELDFFIKNEIMHLDDIENESATKVEQYLGKIKILRAVAHKIIDFLASVENFQKKLWLKKKFVLETNYCVTLDRVSKELYPEIIKNKTQHDEWIKLFAIDEIRGEELGSVPYSNPLTVEFLKANPFLVLDTQFFSTEFKYKLLSSIDNLEENTNGLLIHSENFQALGLLEERFLTGIDSIYIDPPYNTAASEILYKNGYKNSAWISLINDRIKIGSHLLKDTGIQCTTIDDFEFSELKEILKQGFASDLLGTIVIKNNPSGRSTETGFSISHEYALFSSKTNNSKIGRLPRTQAQIDRYSESDSIGNFEWVNFRKHGGFKEDAPTMFYPIYVTTDSVRIPILEWDASRNEYKILEDPSSNEKVVLPIDENGQLRRWKWGITRALNSIEEMSVRVDRTNNLGVYIKSRMNEEGMLPLTVWEKSEYSSTAYGANLLKSIFGPQSTFLYPKSIFAVIDTIKVLNIKKDDSVILDYFAGSGTTGHAVINLNRQDNGNRKYILCEMGKYFDTVTKPRIEKVVYSEDWKDGKPKSRKGSSHMFKYVRLESYEDCLDNLKFDRTKGQDDWLENNPSIREDYMIKYMMDLETKDSILDIKKFETPFDYQINITRDGEIKQVNVDLVETFNFLIGLNVDHIEMLRDVLVVEGTTRAGEKTLVLWRNTNKIDNDALDAWFKKCKYSTADSEFDVIYVNGDNNLENLRRDDQTWKVRLTEAEFQKRMFDVQDVK